MKTEMFTKTLTHPVLSFPILLLPSGRAFWEIQFPFYQKKQDFILQGDYTQEETPEEQTLFKRQTVGKCFSSSVLRFFIWHCFRCCGASKCQTSVPVLDIDYHNFQLSNIFLSHSYLFVAVGWSISQLSQRDRRGTPQTGPQSDAGRVAFHLTDIFPVF